MPPWRTCWPQAPLAWKASRHASPAMTHLMYILFILGVSNCQVRLVYSGTQRMRAAGQVWAAQGPSTGMPDHLKVSACTNACPGSQSQRSRLCTPQTGPSTKNTRPFGKLGHRPSASATCISQEAAQPGEYCTTHP